MVYLADFLLSRFKVGQEVDCLNMDGFAGRLKKVGLRPSQFPAIIELIPWKVLDSNPA
jgi:hypothetical protein